MRMAGSRTRQPACFSVSRLSLALAGSHSSRSDSWGKEERLPPPIVMQWKQTRQDAPNLHQPWRDRDHAMADTEHRLEAARENSSLLLSGMISVKTGKQKENCSCLFFFPQPIHLPRLKRYGPQHSTNLANESDTILCARSLIIERSPMC